MFKQMRIGTLNLQGGNSESKKMNIIEDMYAYKMDALLITETRISGNIMKEMATLDGKQKYKFYTSGLNKNTRYGVGIILPKDTNADFQRITDRICKATIKRIN